MDSSNKMVVYREVKHKYFMKYFPLYFLILLLGNYHACAKKLGEIASKKDSLSMQAETYLVILGTVQDGGSPHIACKKIVAEICFYTPSAADMWYPSVWWTLKTKKNI